MTTHTHRQTAPWGLFPTLGFAFIIFIVFIAVQTMAIALFAYFQLQDRADAHLLSEIQALANNGLAISISLIPGALAGSLLVLLFAYIRKNISIKEYLHLNSPGFKQLLSWIALLILFAIGMEVINHYTQRPMPTWMIDSYKTASILPLFWFTLIVAAPVFEELLFRGFLLEGLRYSKLGDLGAIIITAALWAVIHIQYELFEVASIFLIGILLGYAKVKSQSLYTPIAMHALMNFAATVQIAMLVD